MDAETKLVLRELHSAVVELSKLAKMNCQTANPTFSESTIESFVKPIQASLEEAKKHLA